MVFLIHLVFIATICRDCNSCQRKHEARLEVMIMFPQATYEYQAYHVK